LDNVRVSRSHARLYRQGTQWILEDLGSRNGTLVNGKAISRTAINPEDLIVIAGLPLRLGEIIRPQAQQRWNDNLRFTAHNLCFKVQDKTIIDDISLCFQPGQFVGLVGPSGSGKTTLMMMLNGYLTPTSGLTMLNRLSVHHNPTAFQGQIGYVPTGRYHSQGTHSGRIPYLYQ
jgi:ABC-type multidrug transport system fused ATPase/permease subunit